MIGVLAAAFVHCLSFSWLKWGDILVDCGRDLDVARQLAEGRSLYSDVRYYYGPLAPCLNGSLFRIFGTHLNMVVAAGLVTTALMCWVLYRLARRFTGRTGSAAAAVAFLYICAFGHLSANGIFNFVLPYTPAATYGALTAAACLYFLVRHAQKWRASDFVLSLCFLALTALTKVELLAAALSLQAVFLAGAIWTRRAAWKLHGWGYAAAAAAIGAVYGCFLLRAGFSQVGRQNLFFSLDEQNHRFLLLNMGLLDVRASLLYLLYSILAAGAVFAAAFFSTWQRVPAALRYVVAAGVPLTIYGVLIVAGVFSLEFPFRLLPLVSIGVLAVLGVEWFRRPERREALLPHVLLWLFSLACLSRMLLRTISYHYGFFMLPVGLVTIALLWFEYLPRWLCARGRPSAGFRLAGLGLLLGLTWAHYDRSVFAYGLHTAEASGPRGRLFLFNPPGRPQSGTYYAGAVRLLAEMPPATRVLAAPQGVGLSFLSGLSSSFGLHGYIRPELTGNYDDEHLLALLKAAPPELVIRTTCDLSDYGPHQFGRDYAVKSWGWIEANYVHCLSIGPKGFLTILNRKDVDPAPMLKKMAELQRAPAADPTQRR
ncbi:MAG: glycosyltransferase family 39 protein [Planctomycetota bacterium]|nr:glycosyltransferase family 39 protein [Planctomycetota bacterium]